MKIDELFEGVNDILLQADRPAALLEALCDFAQADAGSLWSNKGSVSAPSIFFLDAVHNRPDAEKFIEKQYFDLDDDGNIDQIIVAKNAIKSKKPIFGKIGDEIFNNDWQKKKYTSDLMNELSIKFVIIVPIFDLEVENPIYVLSLYYKREPSIERNVFSHLAILMSSLNEALEKRLESSLLERRKDRHEVLAHTRVIASKLHLIKNTIKTYLANTNDRNIVLKRYDDMIRSLKVLRTSYERTSFRERVLVKKKHAKFINLKNFLKDTSSAIKNEFSTQADIQVREPIGKNSRILFNEEDLSVLFGSLYINAVKYAVAGSVIRTRISHSHLGIAVQIENDVEINSDEDMDRIWEYEFRGKGKQVKKISGEGIGLGLVSDICDVYNIGYRSKYEIIKLNKFTKVFCITLEVKKEILGS